MNVTWRGLHVSVGQASSHRHPPTANILKSKLHPKYWLLWHHNSKTTPPINMKFTGYLHDYIIHYNLKFHQDRMNNTTFMDGRICEVCFRPNFAAEEKFCEPSSKRKKERDKNAQTHRYSAWTRLQHFANSMWVSTSTANAILGVQTPLMQMRIRHFTFFSAELR